MSALLTTSLPQLPPPKRGKVREVYEFEGDLLIVATDRLSAFDVVMANGVPDKGRILNQMSSYWFGYLTEVCPNHVITTDDDVLSSLVPGWDANLKGRCTLATKAEPLAIECVARGYISGSLLKEYAFSGSSVHGLALPPDLQDGSRLPEPIFTPATKAEEGHDENISFEQAVDIVGREVAELAREWTMNLYSKAATRAIEVGLILADTKFEFGLTDDGLIWIDEALSPDSSRFWEASLWKPGGPQPSFDKQFVRDYLESIDWDKQPPGPELPESVIQQTRAKYVEAFERITQRKFEA
ncbi:phosphoribosylaminoimidazolesuccinocarboxamide synthase [Kamptonema cortianum]|nr:phosphoribosylaminoimidazolesuccinocarboxamide synthase [Geitlerinema splendidum]MDK3156281.1 phosphoribosylaminoimidazolesuccinocarboxamide synthase [Kamptonema cortianum]